MLLLRLIFLLVFNLVVSFGALKGVQEVSDLIDVEREVVVVGTVDRGVLKEVREERVCVRVYIQVFFFSFGVEISPHLI